MPPQGVTISPASAASSLRGRTPAAMITRSAARVLLGVCTPVTSPFSSPRMAVAPSLVNTVTSFSSRCVFSIPANCQSTIFGNNCGINSINVVSIPQRSFSASAISTPMAPPPITTALETLPPAIRFLISMALCRLAMVKTPSRSLPGMGRTNGLAPVASINLS